MSGPVHAVNLSVKVVLVPHLETVYGLKDPCGSSKAYIGLVHKAQVAIKKDRAHPFLNIARAQIP